jgi:hypothetical protein
VNIWHQAHKKVFPKKGSADDPLSAKSHPQRLSKVAIVLVGSQSSGP